MKFTTIGNAKKMTKLSYIGGINISAKIKKNQKVHNQMTYIIYLAPANQSGYNVCPHSTPECRLGCLSTSGRAGMSILSGSNIVQNARIKKTKLFFEHTEFFLNWTIKEIQKYYKQAQNKDMGFSVRLNGTSDINFEDYYIDNKNIFEIFPDIQFYDYTKNPGKVLNNKYKNYHLTFSYSGRNTSICEKLLSKGHNIAVVFNVKKETDLPKKFMGYNVVNGDLSDYRVKDDKGIIIGLKWKNIANKQDNKQIKNSVFVVQPNDERCSY
jgi:hypothetical protein